MMEVRLSEGTLERNLARPPRIPPATRTSAAWGALIGSQGGCGKACSPREHPCLFPQRPSDSPWLSMALPALGLDSRSLLGLLLFQLLLLLLPPPTTAGGEGQGPAPRVKYCAGKGLTIRKERVAAPGWRRVEEGKREWKGSGRKLGLEEPRQISHGEAEGVRERERQPEIEIQAEKGVNDEAHLGERLRKGR